MDCDNGEASTGAGSTVIDDPVQEYLLKRSYASSDSESDDDNVDDQAFADILRDVEVSFEEGDEDVNLELVPGNFMHGWESTENYIGRREEFTDSSGPQKGAKELKDITAIFMLFFSEDFVSSIVAETNRYAQQFISTVAVPWSPFRNWCPVTMKEMYVVIGLFILMGIINKPTIRSYFSRKRSISTPGFGDMISRDRFELICKFLHFTDITNRDNFKGPPKLFKVHPIVAHLNSKFQSLYLPGQNISVNESLTLWKGRLSFKQYLPLKGSKFGIKTFELCESTSGYLWSFVVCAGNDTLLESSLIKPDMSKTTAMVLHLIEPLLNKGRTVWMDNLYNSPELALILKDKGTDCVGTLRLNRPGVPKAIKEKKLKRGEIFAQHLGPVTILKWCYKTYITMISTFHGEESQVEIKRGREIVKPMCVFDYNKHMGGVDLKDEMLQTLLIERKRSLKWYVKFFTRLLNAAVLNSMVIYKRNTGTSMDDLQFKVTLVEGLFQQFGSSEKKTPGRHPSDNTFIRLNERHFLRRIPPRGNKARPQRRCVVCTKNGKRKESVYCC